METSKEVGVMNKKKVIIVIVVAVLAYLLWKKGVFKKDVESTASADSASSQSVSVDLDSVDSIIAASGMTSSDAASVRKFANKVASSLVQQQKMERKAVERGFTYAQMVVLDGLWYVYCTMENGVSVFKPEYTDDSTSKSYYWKMSKKIKNL